MLGVSSVCFRNLTGPVFDHLSRLFVDAGYAIEKTTALMSGVGDIIMALTSYGQTPEEQEGTQLFCEQAIELGVPVIIVTSDTQTVDEGTRILTNAIVHETDLEGLDREVDRIEINLRPA